MSRTAYVRRIYDTYAFGIGMGKEFKGRRRVSSPGGQRQQPGATSDLREPPGGGSGRWKLQQSFEPIRYGVNTTRKAPIFFTRAIRRVRCERKNGRVCAPRVTPLANNQTRRSFQFAARSSSAGTVRNVVPSKAVRGIRGI